MTCALGYAYNPDGPPDAAKSLGADAPEGCCAPLFPGSLTRQHPTTIEE